MGTGSDIWTNNMPAAISQGLVTPDTIRTAMGRALKAEFLMGNFDPFEGQSYRQIPPEAVDSQEMRDLALTVAEESIVLLRNNGILPLTNATKTVAVIGPMTNATQQLLANYHGANSVVNDHSPISAIMKRGVNIRYAAGCDSTICDKLDVSGALNAAKGADVAILIVGDDQNQDHEGTDRDQNKGLNDVTGLGLTGNQVTLIRAIVESETPTVIVNIGGGPMALEEGKEADALLYSIYPGEVGGDAIANVLWGDVNPSGRLPYTIYHANFTRTKTNMDMRAEGGVTYRFYTGPTLWDFGDGCSYSEYSVVCDDAVESNLESIDDLYYATVGGFQCKITNNGPYPGSFPILAFIHGDGDERARKQLFDFQKVSLNPNESQTVYFELGAKHAATIDESGKAHLKPGKYKLSVEAGSSHCSPNESTEIVICNIV